MFNSFPIPVPDSGGGLASPLDWSAYNTVYDLTGTDVSVPASSWNTFVNVTGKGFFKWCRISAGNGIPTANPSIRITIDGIPYTFDTPNAGSNSQGNEVNFEIPFKSSLKIEGFNRDALSIFFKCDYLYLLQQINPNPSKIAILNQSQRKSAYLVTTATSLVDLLNITGSGYLLGVRFLGYYSSAGGSIFGDIIVDGISKMNNRELFANNNETFKQPEIIGPIRFNSALRVRTRVASGSSSTCFVWYTLD